MADIFLRLLNLSISASWLVLVVLVLRFAFKRVPRWVNVLLWGIVALPLMFLLHLMSQNSLRNAQNVTPDSVQSPQIYPCLRWRQPHFCCMRHQGVNHVLSRLSSRQ